MRKINFLLLLLQCLSAATAQQPYSKAVNEQIAQVETNLSAGMVIDGKTYTLSERMKHYNVAGLSVAVIDNYQIVWAKGYGLKSGDNANELIKSLKDDFEYFRNAGFDHSVIKKASETLSL